MQFPETPHYFKAPRPLPDGSPAPGPLCHAISRVVRFNEVDPLNVVWHGHYASYLEDARMALGDRFGIGYKDFIKAKTAAPIRQMHLDYEAPLRFGEECRISAQLFWDDAAKLNFEYYIHNEQGVLATRGYTVQLFVNLSGELHYAKPDFYEAFCQRWLKGELEAQP